MKRCQHFGNVSYDFDYRNGADAGSRSSTRMYREWVVRCAKHERVLSYSPRLGEKNRCRFIRFLPVYSRASCWICSTLSEKPANNRSVYGSYCNDEVSLVGRFGNDWALYPNVPTFP